MHSFQLEPAPRGELSGFVYFEDVPKAARRVFFRAEVVNAQTGRRLGTVTIPFFAEQA